LIDIFVRCGITEVVTLSLAGTGGGFVVDEAAARQLKWSNIRMVVNVPIASAFMLVVAFEDSQGLGGDPIIVTIARVMKF